MTVSAVYACINLISSAIGMLPLNIYRRNISTGEIDQIHDDPLWWVMNEEMTPRWAAAPGMEFGMQGKLLHGDMFMRINRGVNSTPVGLEPIHPNRITVALNPDYGGKRLVYGITPEPLMTGNTDRNEWVVVDQDDMIHVPGPGFNGFRGLSPLRNALRMSGSVSLATQDHTANFFANSARPDMVLQSDQKLSQETIAHLKTQLLENHAGPANAHKPMVIDQGLKWQSMQLSNEDSQLLATRQFQIEEIARIYGVPPWLIGHNEKTTSFGTGIGEIGQAFVRYTLGRHLTKIEKEFNRKLFRTAAKICRFDVAEFERGDLKSLFEAYRVAVGRAGEPGWMTTEEVRQKTGMKLKPDGALNPGVPLKGTP